MGRFTADDVQLTVNSVDLSAWLVELDVDEGAEQNDDTKMGDNTRLQAGGLKTWGGTARLFQDYAAGGPDVTLRALIGTTTAITWRPTSGAIATTNPERQGTALITDYKPQSGSVGDRAMCSFTFVAAGDLTYDVTP